MENTPNLGANLQAGFDDCGVLAGNRDGIAMGVQLHSHASIAWIINYEMLSVDQKAAMASQDRRQGINDLLFNILHTGSKDQFFSFSIDLIVNVHIIVITADVKDIL